MYDVIIIGCGPAGMTAALYLLRANKKVLILEKDTIGGQISSSPLVENYPGIQSISGQELSNNMFEQITNLGVDIELEEAIKIEPSEIKKVITDSNTYEAKSIILATGNKYRLLGLDNEVNLIGSGIHFCVSCDGAFYKGKDVAVIGGGNSGVINAITLSDICNHVYLIQNLDKLTAEESLQDNLKNKKNVAIILDAKVKQIKGDDSLESIIIEHNEKEEEIKLDGMFISIGQIPQNDFVKDLIKLDKFKYIDSNDSNTNVDGIFVAGDCRKKEHRQLTTACNDGTNAALDAIKYLEKYQ